MLLGPLDSSFNTVHEKNSHSFSGRYNFSDFISSQIMIHFAQYERADEIKNNFMHMRGRVEEAEA